MTKISLLDSLWKRDLGELGTGLSKASKAIGSEILQIHDS